MANNYDVGYYEGMEKIVNVPNSLITAITMVMFPRISSLIKQNKDNPNIRDYIQKSLTAVSFFTIGCAFGLLAISNILVPLFLGEGYNPVISLISVGGFMLIPRGIRQVIKSEILLPNGMDKQVTIAIVTGAIIDFIINLLLIPVYKSLGATIATIICEVVSCVVMAYFREVNGFTNHYFIHCRSPYSAS